MMAQTSRVLIVGVCLDLISDIMQQFVNIELQNALSPDELISIIELKSSTSYDLIVVVEGFDNISATDLAQILRGMLRPKTLYFVTQSADFSNREALAMNGYDETFFLPFEKNYLIQSIFRKAEAANENGFSAVRLVDIEPDTTLDFEVAVYMPLNRRYVYLIHAGDRLEAARIDRLKSRNQNMIFVPVRQMSAFYDYSARRLMELEDRAVSSVEQNEKLQSSIREFITGVLSASFAGNSPRGMQTTENIRKVIEKYILIKNGGSLYGQLMRGIGQTRDIYSHSSRVSTFAALFSIALRVASAEDLAVAGILHDIGTMLLPPSIQEKDESKMTRDELDQYRGHPLLSLRAAQKRRLLLSDVVVEAVLQHHERYVGGGYPKNLQGRAMSSSAQILALADRFDYLTRTQEKFLPLDPEQALGRMSSEGIAHPDLHKKLQSIVRRDTNDMRMV